MAVVPTKSLSLRTHFVVPEQIDDEVMDRSATWTTNLDRTSIFDRFVVVLSEQLPILLANHPTLAGPFVQNSLTIQVLPDALEFAPLPKGWPIEMVTLPQVPVRPHLFPSVTHKATKDMKPVKMLSNLLRFAPIPLVLAMKTMFEVISLVQFQITTDNDPFGTIPTLLDLHAVKVSPKSLGCPIEPSARFVEVVALPQMPIGPNMPPMAFLELTQDSTTISMNTNALELAPEPPLLAIEVMVTLVHLPVTFGTMPFCTIPTLLDFLTVQMITNALVGTPNPTSGLVEVIALPQFPRRSDATPRALDIFELCSLTVPVNTNSFETASDPACATMKLVIIMILLPNRPNLADLVPLRSIPPLQDTLLVQVPTNSFCALG